MNRRSSVVDVLLTVLMAICVGLSGWTLHKVAELGEMMAAGVERDASNFRDIADVRNRQNVESNEVSNLQSRVAVIEARLPQK